MKYCFALSFVVAMAAASGCATWHEARFRSRVKNKPAPDFTLTSLDGEEVRLSDYRGKPVVLAFWAYG